MRDKKNTTIFQNLSNQKNLFQIAERGGRRARKVRREVREGGKEGREEGRKERRKEARKAGRKEGRNKGRKEKQTPDPNTPKPYTLNAPRTRNPKPPQHP